jgi:hypothetical protein
MANGFQKFIDENTKGPVNKAFLALSIAEIAQAENKTKALLRVLRDMLLFKPLIAIGMAGAFSAMSKSIRALVHDTGSLRAALEKLKTVQGLHRTFAPFVGGINAAKLKVAELVNFSARNNLELKGVAAAEHSLQELTHGAYAGAEALMVIADAGAASGNGIDATAEAVGGFYAALRGGQPITNAAETLRSMGIVTDEVANELVGLQQQGRTNAEVFDALTKRLKEHKGALAGMKGDLAEVEKRYEAAGDALKEKFGEPFTQSEIENTKNMADAMIAVAPLVERVAPFLEKLTGGFSTAASAVAKWAAANEPLVSTLGNLVKIGTTMVGVFSAVATIGIATWLLTAAGGAATMATAFVAATGATGVLATAVMTLGRVAQGAMIATGLGLLITLAATAYGVYMNFANAAERAAEAQEKVRKAHDETNRAMEKQIQNARNLREQHEAVAKAAQNTAAAYREFQDALADQAREQADPSGWKGIVARLTGRNTFTSSDETNAKVEDAKANYLRAREVEKTAKGRFDPAQGYVTPERAATDREVAIANATLQNDPEGVVRLGNLGGFAGHYERLREMYGDKDAAGKARTLAESDIMSSATVGADRLARLGLGGEFGSGNDVQKQIRDLNKDMRDYLMKIDAKLGETSKSNNPMPTDDNPY